MALKLKQNPTFVAPVDIPNTSGKAERIKITFRHKTKAQYQEWLATLNDKDNPQILFEIIEGWADVPAEFNLENLTVLLENYQAAPVEIYKAYGDALLEGRVKN